MAPLSSVCGIWRNGLFLWGTRGEKFRCWDGILGRDTMLNICTWVQLRFPFSRNLFFQLCILYLLNMYYFPETEFMLVTVAPGWQVALLLCPLRGLTLKTWWPGQAGERVHWSEKPETTRKSVGDAVLSGIAVGRVPPPPVCFPQFSRRDRLLTMWFQSWDKIQT